MDEVSSYLNDFSPMLIVKFGKISGSHDLSHVSKLSFITIIYREWASWSSTISKSSLLLNLVGEIVQIYLPTLETSGMYVN